MRQVLALAGMVLLASSPQVHAQQLPGAEIMVWQQGINDSSQKICGQAYNNDLEKEKLLARQNAGQCGTAAKQGASVLPAGWTKTQEDLVARYTHFTNGAVVMVGPGPADRDYATVARNLDKPEGCTGLSAAKPAPLLSGRGQLQSTTSGAIRCAIITGTSSTGGTVMVIVMEQAIAGANARAFGLDRFSELMGTASAPAPQPTTRTGPVGATTATGIDATLREALARVPAANRPVVMVLRQESSFSGGFSYSIYKPWMLFANGYATDSSCYDWDPRQLSPTPQSLGQVQKDCDILRWRKTGNRYQFLDKDGWQTDEENQQMYPFAAGLRLEKNLENVSGAGGGAPIPGTISVNSVSSGQLRMTKSGIMQSGWSNSVAISGGNIGGGSSGQGVDYAGRYYLDGFLVAVAGPTGQIKIGFIGGANDDGEPRYHRIYLNGDQYWPPE